MKRLQVLTTPPRSRGRAVWIALALLPAGLPVSLAACEGEPPINAPENTIAAAPSSAPASGSAPASAPESAPGQIPCAPPPCAPATPAVASATGPAALPAPEASASAALPVPPVDVARGNIVGNVTTQPASLKGLTVVYLEDAPKEDSPAHLQTITIANRQMTFIPYISVAAVGAKVVFSNEDPFPHNVFSPDGDKFNMGNIPQNGAHFRVFKNSGEYSLLCNLHPGMLGYLVVTPSTFYARTDAKGAFSMKHVPAGTYKVTAWAPRQKPETQSVTVAAGDVSVNFDLKR